MNAPTVVKLDKSDFYRFIRQEPEGRFEFVAGRIVQQMTGGTYRHGQIGRRFVQLLVSQLGEAGWGISGSDRGVDTPTTVRYPDVVVEQAPIDPKSLTTLAPVLLVEVLSPTTEGEDLNRKSIEYLGLPSLTAYIVASQDDMACRVWQRNANGTFDAQPEIVRGPDGVIGIAALGATIALSDIYRGIL